MISDPPNIPSANPSSSAVDVKRHGEPRFNSSHSNLAQLNSYYAMCSCVLAFFQRKVERQNKCVPDSNTFLTSANNGDCTVYLMDCIFLRTHFNAILNDVMTALLRERNHILVLIKIL